MEYVNGGMRYLKIPNIKNYIFTNAITKKHIVKK